MHDVINRYGFRCPGILERAKNNRPIGIVDLRGTENETPTVIDAAGNKPKIIEEFIGLVNSKTSDLSIARMKSPAGWVEPEQKHAFTEYTVVLKGMLRVKTVEEQLDIHSGKRI
jgi:hypothetical protein